MMCYYISVTTLWIKFSGQFTPKRSERENENLFHPCRLYWMYCLFISFALLRCRLRLRFGVSRPLRLQVLSGISVTCI